MALVLRADVKQRSFSNFRILFDRIARAVRLRVVVAFADRAHGFLHIRRWVLGCSSNLARTSFSSFFLPLRSWITLDWHISTSCLVVWSLAVPSSSLLELGFCVQFRCNRVNSSLLDCASVPVLNSCCCSSLLEWCFCFKQIFCCLLTALASAVSAALFTVATAFSAALLALVCRLISDPLTL